jgi:hypothetical protein
MIGEMMRRHCQRDAEELIASAKVNVLALILTLVASAVVGYLYIQNF